MDKVIEFEGATAHLFVSFVKYKKSLGYRMAVCSQYTLRGINRIVEGLGEVDAGTAVSAEAMRVICAKREGESESTREKRVVMLRQFCIFLSGRGLRPVTPPPGMVKPSRTFVPHVFSEEEMAQVVAEADCDIHAWAGLATRLLWCCGLRMGEVCNLTLGDVDLEAGTLLVRRSKGDRTRIVPMSRSMWSFMSEYIESAAFAAWLVESAGRAPSTANNRMAAIKSFMRYCQLDGHRA